MDMVSRLAPAMIRALAARAESLDLASGEIVFEQGDNSDGRPWQILLATSFAGFWGTSNGGRQFFDGRMAILYIVWHL